jgi:hypothetical protein
VITVLAGGIAFAAVTNANKTDAILGSHVRKVVVLEILILKLKLLPHAMV